MGQKFFISFKTFVLQCGAALEIGSMDAPEFERPRLLQKVVGPSREGRAMRQSTGLRSKLSATVCATILAAAVSASAKEGETRTCETKLGGQVVCGDLVIGMTLEQYEAGLKKRAEEIRGEEAEKRIQLQKRVDLTERATSAEKDGLRSQIAAVEAEKRALEAES